MTSLEQLERAQELDRKQVELLDRIIDAHADLKRRVKKLSRLSFRLAAAIKRGASRSHIRNLARQWEEAKAYRDRLKIKYD